LVRTGAVATRASAAIIATTPIIVVVRVFNSLVCYDVGVY
jgi:hypothetical protein